VPVGVHAVELLDAELLVVEPLVVADVLVPKPLDAELLVVEPLAVADVLVPKPLDAELLVVEPLAVADVLVPKPLDAELLVIALLVVVDVLVPLAPKAPAELPVLELPLEPPTMELELPAAPTPPPSARIPSPIPRIESQPTRLRPKSAVRHRVPKQSPLDCITTSPPRSGRPYSNSGSARHSRVHGGRSPTS
jgi:hypothetical protein